MILGLDTSGAISVAVADASGEQILAVNTDNRARHHAEVLIPMVEDVLAEARVERSEITQVVAGRGPGPFTGLRVGLVTARMLARVLDVPIVGVSSLDALALETITQARSLGRTSGTAYVALDARRKEVYWAAYSFHENGWQLLTPPSVAKPAEIAEKFANPNVVCAGRGVELYSELFVPDETQAMYLPEVLDPSAGYLIKAALVSPAEGAAVGIDTNPMYLREPDAAVPTARKSALGK